MGLPGLLVAVRAREHRTEPQPSIPRFSRRSTFVVVRTAVKGRLVIRRGTELYSSSSVDRFGRAVTFRDDSLGVPRMSRDCEFSDPPTVAILLGRGQEQLCFWRSPPQYRDSWIRPGLVHWSALEPAGFGARIGTRWVVSADRERARPRPGSEHAFLVSETAVGWLFLHRSQEGPWSTLGWRG